MTDDDMRRARSDWPVRNRQKSVSRLIYPAYGIFYVPGLCVIVIADKPLIYASTMYAREISGQSKTPFIPVYTVT